MNDVIYDLSNGLDLDLDNNCQSPDGYFGNGVIFNNLEWPLTQISWSQYFSKSNMSKTVRARQSHSYYWTLIGSHMWSIKWCNLQWPQVTPNPGLKVTVVFKVECFSKRCIWYCPTADNLITCGNLQCSVSLTRGLSATAESLVQSENIGVIWCAVLTNPNSNALETSTKFRVW